MAIEAADALTPVGGTGKLAHSIKVPQFYKFSSKVLLNYLQFKGRIPKLIQQQTRGEKECWIKQVRSFLLALVAELDIVRAALNNVGVLEKNPYLRVETALVIAGDMLLSLSRSQRLTSQCKPVLTMLEVEKELQEEYQKLLQNAPVKLGLVVPRWVCINTLLISTQKARQHLSDEGFTLKSYSPKTYEKFLQSIQDLGKWDYMEDFHFAEVLVFSASTAVMSSTLVSSGKLLLQDKVSWLSPFVSAVQPGDVVLDACAAPGNKSTVLAGLMANQGKLICIERDPERFTVLKKRVKHHGVRNVLFINEDFTSVDPSELQGVTTILLDPSCSNSGLEMNTDSASVSGERYRRLADMQFQLLSFALSLPSVQSVVYSTCSVQSIENEEVVARALQQFTNFELDDLSLKLKDWRSFGDENYSFAKKVLRTQTFYDLCHGFFVAKFVARRVFLNGKTESETAEPKEENSKKKPKTVLGAKAENSVSTECNSDMDGLASNPYSSFKNSMSFSDSKQKVPEGREIELNDAYCAAESQILNEVGGSTVECHMKGDSRKRKSKKNIELEPIEKFEESGLEKESKKKRRRLNPSEETLLPAEFDETKTTSSKKKLKSQISEGDENNEVEADVTAPEKQKKKKKKSCGDVIEFVADVEETLVNPQPKKKSKSKSKIDTECGIESVIETCEADLATGLKKKKKKHEKHVKNPEEFGEKEIISWSALINPDVKPKKKKRKAETEDVDDQETHSSDLTTEHRDTCSENQPKKKKKKTRHEPRNDSEAS